MEVTDYLQEENILFLDAANREESLYALVKQSKEVGVIDQTEEFYEAVLDREAIVSTGIGMGVAIPHAKLPSVLEFFITIGVQKGKGIFWDSLDHSLVKLIFLIGGPSDRQSDYLQILSKLTAVIKDETLRKEILQAESKSDVIALLEKFVLSLSK